MLKPFPVVRCFEKRAFCRGRVRFREKYEIIKFVYPSQTKLVTLNLTFEKMFETGYRLFETSSPDFYGLQNLRMVLL